MVTARGMAFSVSTQCMAATAEGSGRTIASTSAAILFKTNNSAQNQDPYSATILLKTKTRTAQQFCSKPRPVQQS
jgi:hypothetical protein